MRGRGLAGKRADCMTTRVDDGLGGEVSNGDEEDGRNLKEGQALRPRACPLARGHHMVETSRCFLSA